MPDLRLIRAEILKLRRRPGLMAAAGLLAFASAVLYLVVLMVLHALDPAARRRGGAAHFDDAMGILGMAGSVAGVIVGATAGGADIEAGVFRDLAATGRSRIALFAARVPGRLGDRACRSCSPRSRCALLAVALAGARPRRPRTTSSPARPPRSSAASCSSRRRSASRRSPARAAWSSASCSPSSSASRRWSGDRRAGQRAPRDPVDRDRAHRRRARRRVRAGHGDPRRDRVGRRDARRRPVADADPGDLSAPGLGSGHAQGARPGRRSRGAPPSADRAGRHPGGRRGRAGGRAVRAARAGPALRRRRSTGRGARPPPAWRRSPSPSSSTGRRGAAGAGSPRSRRARGCAIVTVAVGSVVRERRRGAERERALLAGQAVAEERLRIARELHDAVGHDVSLMVVQAQAVGATHDDPGVREATDAIADLGRRTMAEMHRTLRVLRDDDAARRPQPSLDALDDVLDGARAAGVDVRIAMEGAARPLDPALDASAYRIVQEAVTNVVRHAGGGPATVTVRYGPDALELVVADEGAGGGERRGRRRPRARRDARAGRPVRRDARGGAARRPRLRRARRPPVPGRRAVSRVRVVIADDQPLMRAGFKAVLEATGSIVVVAEAGDGEEAIAAAEAHAPDVVLMDIRMPRVDGIEATRRLPRRRVLILTTFGLDEYIVEALRAGASGFLTKDAPAADLVAAVRAVAAGDAVLSPQVTRRLLDRVAGRLPPATGPGADGTARLTEREREVLTLVAAGLSNAEIASALVLAEPTVKSHVSNLLGKLGLRDRVQAVIWAYEHGLVERSRTAGG